MSCAKTSLPVFIGRLRSRLGKRRHATSPSQIETRQNHGNIAFAQLVITHHLFNVGTLLIKSEQKNAAVVYRYAWGNNFEKEEWSRNLVKVDGKRLAQKVTLIKNKIGSWIQKESFSFSGDWVIASEHYYDEEGKLFFVFWKMNTFQADEPVTVEKRLYFDKYGKVIRNMAAVYKMNTKQETKASFMDRDVVYETSFGEQDFLKHLQN